MDINDLRGLTTLLVMIAFLGVCIWAFNPKRKKRFDDAAQLPFADDEADKEAHEQAAAQELKAQQDQPTDQATKGAGSQQAGKTSAGESKTHE